jgi:hypothetical protein
MQGFRRRTVTHLEFEAGICGHCHISIAAKTIKKHILRYTKPILKEIKRKKRNERKTNAFWDLRHRL